MTLMETISAQLHRQLPEDWPEVELTMLQLRVLMVLSRGPRRMSDISADVGTSLQAMTNLIARLVDKGLVERMQAEDDRRVVLCHLTPLGKREVDRFWRINRTYLEEIANYFTDEQLTMIIEAMSAIAAAMAKVPTSGAGSSEPIPANEPSGN